MTLSGHRWTLQPYLLLIVLGCETRQESAPPPPLNSIAQPGRVTWVDFDEIREHDGRPLPGPIMLLRLALQDFRSAPTTLGIHLLCESGNLVFVDEGAVAVSHYVPDTAVYAAYGGLSVPGSPERCEVRVQAKASAGSGVQLRELGTFCLRPRWFWSGACSTAPPDPPPYVYEPGDPPLRPQVAPRRGMFEQLGQEHFGRE